MTTTTEPAQLTTVPAPTWKIVAPTITTRPHTAATTAPQHRISSTTVTAGHGTSQTVRVATTSSTGPLPTCTGAQLTLTPSAVGIDASDDAYTLVVADTAAPCQIDRRLTYVLNDNATGRPVLGGVVFDAFEAPAGRVTTATPQVVTITLPKGVTVVAHLGELAVPPLRLT